MIKGVGERVDCLLFCRKRVVPPLGPRATLTGQKGFLEQRADKNAAICSSYWVLGREGGAFACGFDSDSGINEGNEVVVEGRDQDVKKCLRWYCGPSKHVLRSFTLLFLSFHAPDPTESPQDLRTHWISRP